MDYNEKMEKLEKENPFISDALATDPRDPNAASIQLSILALVYEVSELREMLDEWSRHQDEVGFRHR